MSVHRPGNKFIFISYSRKNRKIADAFEDVCKSAGFRVWLDRGDLRAGVQWREEIAQAIEQCSVFLLLMSPAAKRSKYVREEIDLIASRMKADRGGKLFPTVIRGRIWKPGDTSIDLNEYQIIDLSSRQASKEKIDEFIDELAQALVIPADRTSGAYQRARKRLYRLLSRPWRLLKMFIVMNLVLPAVLAVLFAIDWYRTWSASESRFDVGTPNAEWTPRITAIDGFEMVEVPAGCFMMGSENGDSDERPLHKICIDQPFWIDRYEVSNAQYERLGGTPETSERWQDPKHPRVNITWSAARNFCETRGMRLPNEAEWEYATRGPEGLGYPWGNAFIPDNVVYAPNVEDKMAEVGSKPGGASWVGALDLSGNVWEWTSSIVERYPYQADDGREAHDALNTVRVIRGGSWLLNDPLAFRSSNRYVLQAQRTAIDVGFRCVSDK